MKRAAHAGVSGAAKPAGRTTARRGARDAERGARIFGTDVWKQAVKPLFGQICWKAKYAPYTNLILEFGRPTLEVTREPYRSNRRVCDPYLQMLPAKRLAAVVGRWCITIRMAYWKILFKGELLATSSSSTKKTDLATWLLEGQKLVDVAVNPKNGSTTFTFDIGGVLEARRMEAVGADPVWWITEHGRDSTVIVYGDGSSRRGRSTEPAE